MLQIFTREKKKAGNQGSTYKIKISNMKNREQNNKIENSNLKETETTHRDESLEEYIINILVRIKDNIVFMKKKNEML